MNFEIVLFTSNQNKVEEFRKLLSPHRITLYSFKDLNLTMPDVIEDGKTFIDNSLIKAKAGAKIVNLPILADDSGLEIEALNGFPGVKSARYIDSVGGPINAMHDILNKLKDQENRNAKFTCCLTLLNVKKDPLVFIGEVNGKITTEYHDETSFGFDPIFYSDELKMTFHQSGKELKSTVSHRGRAIKKLLTTLKILGYIDK